MMSEFFYSDIKLIKYAVLFYYLYQMFDFFFKSVNTMIPIVKICLTNFRYQ